MAAEAPTPAQIAALRALLAAVDTSPAAEQAGFQFSENQRDSTDDGTAKGIAMCRIDGPFERKDRKNTRYRLRVVDRETNRTKMYSYPTREAAEGAINGLYRQYRRPVGVPMSEALTEYETHLKTRGNVSSRGPNKPSSVETTMYRLKGVLDTDTVTGELTAKAMIEMWQAWVTGKATDTALNTLAQLRTFLGWLHRRQWTKNPDVLRGIEVVGRRNKGKPKLSQDEAEALVNWCLSRPEDVGAVATLCAYWLGMRASEITSRIVRNLDGKGALLDITEAKTVAGERTLKLPTKLQPLLAGLAKNKTPEDRLFGNVNRHWLRREVKRCCLAAGVREVGPQGLRGTHAKVAREVGVSGVLLATAMGHESETTTTEHYAGRGAVAQSEVDRVSATIN
jgi:integrase